MSIQALMQREMRRPQRDDRDRSVAGSETPLTGAPAVDDGVTNVAATLAAYVPTEAIALYTSALAFLVPADMSTQPQSYEQRWLLAGTVMILAVLYAVGTVRREQKRMMRPVRVPWSKVAVVVVAFAAWVCVIPGSPFNSFSWYTPATGAVIGLVTNAFLGVFGLYFDDA